ncbi:hypothetical protein EMIHUDRAFT_224939 [Emiliania huxleyi CCMP1516]|uniref:Uncharacterized protein n=2 Tax=Emiliania huxleyi TaxID=2903 RepID=A0A0D3KQA4_EMIH1|nr:hypothetical protein EMIHUDRAFT_224939 [Emiliania huxleyi CCMP1516]EOD37939.1 hypothetical protein EMIHUDRAFT_224939 [Emiliania huxleyi CCMP1516]|eukprot:XP_005790368.1 hypothetical protein EMIHUDRAFT_224939 [Emiliania huxleyi CCMP1516]
MADARMVRPVAEFDLSSAVGVGGLTAAAGIAIRSASCQQPRVAALLLQLLLSVFCSHALAARGLGSGSVGSKADGGGAACQGLLLAEVERLSAARAKGKKGKKKKKMLNEEMLSCS